MQQRMSFHLPIAAKAMLFIGVLGVMSGAANWFCLRSLHEIDRINAQVTERVEPARLTLTEAKIAVESLGLATYKMAGTNDPDTMREATDELAGQYAAAKAWLNVVVDYLPGHREDVDGMLRRLDLVNAIADSVKKMAAAGDHERARSTLEFKFDPALVDAATSMNRLIDILGGETKVTIEAAADDKAWTYKLLRDRVDRRHDCDLVAGNASGAPFGGAPAATDGRRHAGHCARSVSIHRWKASNAATRSASWRVPC